MSRATAAVRAPHWLAAVATVAVSAALTTSCGGGDETTTASAPGEKVFRYSMDQAPNNLDPVQAATVYTGSVVLNAYDTLFAYKFLARPYAIKANLATGMPTVSDEGLTYEYTLKPGVYFIDDAAFADGKGREVVAADVVYSLKRHFDPASLSQGAWLWQGRIEGLDAWGAAGADYAAEVPGLTAPDKYTLRIRLTQPFPQLTYTLATAFSAVVPREAVEKYGRGLWSRPVGSGPFIVEFFDTARAVLRRNPNFRAEPVNLADEGFDPALHAGLGFEALEGRSPPFVDRLTIDFIGENSARWNSFTKGDEIQYIYTPNEYTDQILASKAPVTLKPELAERYHLLAGTEAGLVFHTFNLDDTEFGYNDDPQRAARNKALRCAMIKAFDWPERNARFYSGLGTVFAGVIPPTVPEYDPDIPSDSIVRDVAGGRQLLADNGWTAETLPRLVYGTTGDVTQRQYFEQYRAWMVELGFPSDKIELKQYATFGELSRAWKQSKLPMVNKGWTLDYPDAENVLQLFYGPNGSPGSNDANYRNAIFDDLFERTKVMQPGPERTRLYRQMNRILVDDCVAHLAVARTRILLWHKDAIVYPDREMASGFFLKYVDVIDSAEAP
ncbi:MAG: ABC transporter substrate-binding protein [Pseudomonadota bacterium]